MTARWCCTYLVGRRQLATIFFRKFNCGEDLNKPFGSSPTLILLPWTYFFKTWPCWVIRQSFWAYCWQLGIVFFERQWHSSDCNALLCEMTEQVSGEEEIFLKWQDLVVAESMQKILYPPSVFSPSKDWCWVWCIVCTLLLFSPWDLFLSVWDACPRKLRPILVLKSRKVNPRFTNILGHSFQCSFVHRTAIFSERLSFFYSPS